MWPKVVDGKIAKWFTEVTLLGQDNVWEQGAGTVDKIRGELGKKLGGEVKVTSFVRFGLGEGIEKKVENLADEVAKTIGAWRPRRERRAAPFAVGESRRAGRITGRLAKRGAEPN